MKKQRKIFPIILSILAVINFTCCSFLINQFTNSAAKTNTGSNSIGNTPDISEDGYIKVSGEVNGTYIKYLRSLLENEIIDSIDLSEAVFVSGGEAFYENDGKPVYSVDGEIPPFLFRGCSNLKNIILPTSVSVIGERAFSRTGLAAVVIPDNITKIGGDAFSYTHTLVSVVIGKNLKECGQGVFHETKIKNAYVKAAVPPAINAYHFSSSPEIHVYSEALEVYQKSRWADFGTIVGDLDNTFPDEMDLVLKIRPLMKNYFSDYACTSLQEKYRSMTDSELYSEMSQSGIPENIINIAVKIKNDDWEKYEKDFRIHEYSAYSDAEYWNNKLKSYGGSYMGNPTGIYCEEESILYVFVDSNIPDDASLYFEGVTENKLIYGAKKGTPLNRGLNIIQAVPNALYYVLYTADTKSMTKKLTEWPGIKIHIEGGIVNGYYDVTRHSDQDYRELLENASHDLFTIKGEDSVFNFKTATYRKHWPESIEKSIRWYDSLSVREKEVTGICDSVVNGERADYPLCLTGGNGYFPSYYNNPSFAIQGNEADAGYANATNYRTSYNSMGCCSMSFDPDRSDFDDWCAAHECGHLLQSPINLEGTGEVANNLFSNITVYSDGFRTTSGKSLEYEFNDYANHTPYFTRDIWSMTRMYYQLYLYYHLAKKNTSFYPELFKALREDPTKLYGQNDNGNKGSLKFIRKVCELAQEDLTDFFTMWGLLEPCEVLEVGKNYVTVSQENIDATIEEISKYPKKNRAICFIEDRIPETPLISDGKAYTEKGNSLAQRKNPPKTGEFGDLGQYTDYLEENYTLPSYSFYKAENKISLDGSGGVGFFVKDGNGKIIYASNKLCFMLPENVSADFTIHAVDARGNLYQVPYGGSADFEVELTQAGTLSLHLPQAAVSAKIKGPINGSDAKYLRKLIDEKYLTDLDLSEARIVASDEVYYEYEGVEYKTEDNKLGSYMFRDCENLTSIILPSTITEIGERAFSNTSLTSVTVPEGVIKICYRAFSYCKKLEKIFIPSTIQEFRPEIFTNCTKFTDFYIMALTPPELKVNMFGKQINIHIKPEAMEAYSNSIWNEKGPLIGDIE